MSFERPRFSIESATRARRAASVDTQPVLVVERELTTPERVVRTSEVRILDTDTEAVPAGAPKAPKKTFWEKLEPVRKEMGVVAGIAEEEWHQANTLGRARIHMGLLGTGLFLFGVAPGLTTLISLPTLLIDPAWFAAIQVFGDSVAIGGGMALTLLGNPRIRNHVWGLGFKLIGKGLNLIEKLNDRLNWATWQLISGQKITGKRPVKSFVPTPAP